MLFLVLLVTVTTSLVVGAEQLEQERLSPEDVPPALQPWMAWTLAGHTQQLCPQLQGFAQSWRCAWPGSLVLGLDDDGGRFEQQWHLRQPSWSLLPGGGATWPLEVRDRGRAVAVVSRSGRPAVYLSAGDHLLRGRFSWPRMPESLAVPEEIALLELTVRGQPVPVPRREENGELLLASAGGDTEDEREHLEISVHRRLADGVPVELTTRLLLEVAGRPREVVLAPVVPEGFVLTSVLSPLPARLENDMRLRLHLSAGRWELLLQARHQGPLTEVGMADSELLWSANEVWVFAADPAVRVVEVSGVQPTDPRQTSLPQQWQSLPAYRLFPGDHLQLQERRRGDEDPAADSLQLRRALWLDFDGTGYTVQDRLNGQLHRSWRLTADPALALGHVVVNDADLLITELEPGQGVGVELRDGTIEMTAESRYEGARGAVPAVGWDCDVDQASLELQLPPGWRLLLAAGVDQASGTWMARWTLLDLFLCCIAVMAILRMRGQRWAVVAAATLVLTWTEPLAPQWSWLWLVAALALVEHLPRGTAIRLALGGLAVIMVVLVTVAVPFCHNQIKLALYPDLARSSAVAFTPSVALEQRTEQESDEETWSLQSAVSRSKAGALSASRPPHQVRQEKQVATQTGPGVPGWSWESARLSWKGPVTRDQQVRLVLVPPWVNRVLGFARPALLVLLLVGLVRPRSATWQKLWTGAGAGQRGWVAVLAVMLFVPLATAAEEAFPSQQLLQELRQRLLAVEMCQPVCAEASSMRVRLSGEMVQIDLDIQNLAAAAVPLPGGVRWLPERVTVDGKPALGLVRHEGAVWVLLDEGVHRVQLQGRLFGAQVLRLPLPLRPHRVMVQARGWRVDGVHDNGTVDEVLQLTRLAGQSSTAATAADDASALIELAPHLVVTRTLVLRLTWEVHTTVHRLSPTGTPIVIEVPLLIGESVTSAGVHVDGTTVLVNLAPHISELSWISTLQMTPEIRLVAPEGDGWAERWRLHASPLWHVERVGIPPIHQPGQTGERIPEWRPWPGEELVLQVHRPAGVEGPTVTIDSSVLTLTPGHRATDAVLALEIRSSIGGTHQITVPATAELTRLVVNESELPVHQNGREVQVQLAPGSTAVQLEWRHLGGFVPYFRTPDVNLGVPSVNAQLKVEVPPSRWLLLLVGPGIGPAVLYWSLFVVLIAVAVALGKLRVLPLQTWQWILLLVGLSQVPVAAAIVVVLWFLALSWRRARSSVMPAVLHNLVLLLLLAWTVVVMLVLFAAIYQGLLDAPEMHVAGNLSTSAQLTWYSDRSPEVLPQALILSLPVVVYRLIMLAWAVWLAVAVTSWLRWGWEAVTSGALWRPLRKAEATPQEPSSPHDPSYSTSRIMRETMLVDKPEQEPEGTPEPEDEPGSAEDPTEGEDKPEEPGEEQ